MDQSVTLDWVTTFQVHPTGCGLGEKALKQCRPQVTYGIKKQIANLSNNSLTVINVETTSWSHGSSPGVVAAIQRDRVCLRAVGSIFGGASIVHMLGHGAIRSFCFCKNQNSGLRFSATEFTSDTIARTIDRVLLFV